MDPGRVDIPQDWGSDPLRVLSGTETLLLREEKSVRPTLPARLNISRTSWLTLTDGELSHREVITGEMRALTRLDFTQNRMPQFVHDNKHNRLITSSATAAAGVEIRTPSVQLTAGSIEKIGGDKFRVEVPVNGLRTEAEELGWELRIPYGWTILHATGADSAFGLWWQQFSPGAVILIIGNAIASFSLLGVSMATVLTLCSVAEIDGNFPWIVLIGNCCVIAQKTLFRESDFAPAVSAIVKPLFLISFLWVVLCSIYPALHDVSFPAISTFNDYATGYTAKANYNDARVGDSADVLLTFANGAFGALIMVAAGVGAIIAGIFGKHKAATGLLIVSTGCFITRSLISTWFNDSSLTEDSYSSVATYSGYGTTSFPISATRSDTLKGSTIPETLKMDTSNIPQTGNPLPAWTGTTVFMTWRTGATASRTLTLFLLPWYIMITIKSILMILIAFVSTAQPGRLVTRRNLPAMVLMALLIAPSGYAEFPPQYLLDELANRMRPKTPAMEETRCTDSCYHFEHLGISIHNNALTLTARIHSDGESVWSIPSTIQVTDLSIDGNATPVHGSQSLGTIVRLGKGISRLMLHGEVMPSKAINPGLRPGYLELDAPDWRSSNEPLLRLLPLNQESENGGREKWFILRRKINLGRTWSISNTLSVVGSSRGESLLQIPLLKDERVLNSSPEVRGKRLDDGSGIAQIKLKDVEQVSWISQIAPSDTVVIPSLDNIGISQHWELSCRDDFQCIPKTEAVALEDSPG